MDHYLQLLTTEELSTCESEQWNDIVLELAPDGSVMVEVDEDMENYHESDMDDCRDCEINEYPYVYTVNLTRNLEPSEIEFIVAAWEVSYDGDFQIEGSSSYEIGMDIQAPFELDIDEHILETVKSQAAKFLHNRWVSEQVDKGWRYGAKYDLSGKSHPALRDWDSLHESYRKFPVMTKQEALDFLVKYQYKFK
mgnify:CR=1 FL=1|jgi:hypothetical protein